MSAKSLLEAAHGRLRSGDLRGAIATVNKGLGQHRKDYRFWLLASELELRAGRGQPSVQAAREAEKLRAADATVQVQLGRALAAIGNVPHARAAADAAMRLDPQDAVLLDGIGAIYSACDEQGLALPLFERAVALAPRVAHFQFNLATAMRFAGRFAEAEAAADRAIALDPRDFGAIHLRSDLRRQTPEHNHVAELDALRAADNLPWLGRVQVCYALARELEDLGEYQRSFAALREGADLRRSHLKYDVQEDVRTMQRVAACHTAAVLGALGAGYPNREPIFVLGLPRTGTTLVERILGNHRDVTAAGELRHFPAEMIRLCIGARRDGVPARDEMVEASLKLDMHSLGRCYIESTRPKTGTTPRFVDKLPMNFLYCGLIRAALPGAKIVHLRRDPMDTCYAIYKTLFSRAYPFSYDLSDLGHYYVAYRRLMQHWQSALPGAILELDYEALVADPEAVTRRLLEFCELEFEPACLDFHRSATASTTASAVQVRQPVYTDSVGKWKHFAAQLEPCAAILRAAGIPVESA
jgi:tetratricopeptide (TPR) repeat protein